YILVGSIIMEGQVFRHLVGGIICLVGLAYVGLEFVPSIEPPVTMREEEAAWGAEQI
ncbi:Late Golgi vesicles protein, partial [Ascosphaera aggregata]